MNNKKLGIIAVALIAICVTIVVTQFELPKKQEVVQEKTAGRYFDQYTQKRVQTQSRFESCKIQLDADNAELKALYSGFQQQQTGEYMTNRVSSFTSEQVTDLQKSTGSIQ